MGLSPLCNAICMQNVHRLVAARPKPAQGATSHGTRVRSKGEQPLGAIPRSNPAWAPIPAPTSALVEFEHPLDGALRVEPRTKPLGDA